MPLRRRQRPIRREPEFAEALEENHRRRKDFIEQITGQKINYNAMPFPKTRTGKTKKQEKSKEERQTLNKRKEAYLIAEERDGHKCQGCGSPYFDHHHILFGGRKKIDDYRNIVCLCFWCHQEGPEAPHSPEGGEYGRTKWEKWQMERYPEFVREIREREQIAL